MDFSNIQGWIVTASLWPMLLISFGLILVAIWFAYDEVAAVARARLTIDATKMQKIMEASFVNKTIEECAEILARVFWGAAAGMFLLTAAAGLPNPILSIIFGFAAYIVANIWVARQTKMRMEQFEKQLPDVLTLMANTLKSGLTLQQSLDICAREMSKPASHEFFLVVSEIRVGATAEEALQHLAERMPIQEVEMLVTTVTTLRQSGGNLTESFETIAHVIKERNAVRGKIKALTAEGMFQGKLLAALPFVFIFILYVTSREFVMPMLVDPIGWAIMVLMLLFVSFGYWLMSRLVAIDV